MNQFKVIPDKLLLYNLLTKICDIKIIDNKKYYEFNYRAYNKGLIDNSIIDFVQTIKPYYTKNTAKFCDNFIKENSYNKFTTILRQICKANMIDYKHPVKWRFSDYCIVYYIDSTV